MNDPAMREIRKFRAMCSCGKEHLVAMTLSEFRDQMRAAKDPITESGHLKQSCDDCHRPVFLPAEGILHEQ